MKHPAAGSVNRIELSMVSVSRRNWLRSRRGVTVTRDLGRGRRARRANHVDPRFRAGAAGVQAWANVVAAEPGTTQRADAEVVLAAMLNELARAYMPPGTNA